MCLGVNCPCVPTCSCACSFFCWVTLHKVKCPKKMKNLPFIREDRKINESIPHLNCNLHATTKVGSKPTVFRFIGANRLAKSILDVFSDYLEIGRRWRALSRSLRRRRDINALLWWMQLCAVVKGGRIHTWKRGSSPQAWSCEEICWSVSRCDETASYNIILYVSRKRVILHDAAQTDGMIAALHHAW